MKKNFITLFIGSIVVFSSCRKEILLTEPNKMIAEICLLQTSDPSGTSYPSDSIVSFTCTSKFCGMMPLSAKNYWVYEDSIFSNGIFVKVQYDTLRFNKTWKSLTDGLVWWEGNIEVGLPDKLYANDSALFKIENRLFTPGIVDAKKDYSLFEGDSLRYLASFEDAAAQGRSVKLTTAIVTQAGTFTDCVYFEKNARSYRRDQIYFKTGIGVIKYIQEKAPMGSPFVKLQQISTLAAFHIE